MRVDGAAGCAWTAPPDARDGAAGYASDRGEWLQPPPHCRELQEGLLGLEDAVRRTCTHVRGLTVKVGGDADRARVRAVNEPVRCLRAQFRGVDDVAPDR